MHNSVQYKPSFSCEINCTKVKQTATKLHKIPDETDRARSWRLLQMRYSDSTPLAPKATALGEMIQNSGHYAVQGHSMSPLLVPKVHMGLPFGRGLSGSV